MKSKACFFILVSLLFFQYFRLSAQTEVVNFLQGGLSDGEKLFKAYITPYGNVLGTDINGGWFNSAAVHKFPGFDLTVTVSASFVPSSDKNFDISKLSLSTLKLADSTNHIAPTIAGSTTTGPELQYFKTFNGTPVKLGQFNTPKGTGWGYFPLPMIKAAVGIPGGFELMGRYMPTYKKKDLSIGLWGIGLKHDILQYIPVMKRLPFLNLSVMGAYTSVKSTAGVNYQWTVYQDAGIPVTYDKVFSNQNLELTCRGITANLLLSLNFPLITIYGAGGYSSSTTSFKLLGDYPVVEMDNTGSPYIVPYNNPVNISIDNFSGFQYTGGIRLKFGVLTIHADYTHEKYSMVSGGIGISIR